MMLSPTSCSRLSVANSKRVLSFVKPESLSNLASRDLSIENQFLKLIRYSKNGLLLTQAYSQNPNSTLSSAKQMEP